AHHRQAPYRIEDALIDMDAAGVTRAVNCPAIWDAGANDYAVEAATAHPDRFATLGWFALESRRAPEFVGALLDRPSMLGLRFVVMKPAHVEAMGAGELDWVWDVANERQRPVAL